MGCRLQAISEDKAVKRKKQQAEYDRVSEIHRGRVESSSVDATDAATVHSCCVHVKHCPDPRQHSLRSCSNAALAPGVLI